MSAPIADRHDNAIRDLVLAGLSGRQVAARLHRYAPWIRRRIRELGLRDRMLANAAEASRRAGGSSGCVRVQARMCRPEGDGGHAAACARIVRTLRHAALPPGDNVHLAACLHARGVTLDDLDAHLGVPPAAVIAAIRQQAGLRP